VKVRLVVENDDRLYSLRECLSLHDVTGVPILFDNFHHECLNHGEPMTEALRLAASTWNPTRDGVLMMDYSSQSLGERKGKHTDSLVPELFRGFVADLQGLDVDMMLEIKDKEASAIKGIGILRELGLVSPAPAGYEPPVFAPRPTLTDAEGRPIAPAAKPRKTAKKVATPPAAGESPAQPKVRRTTKTK
jgi:UV DNA damage endonuclease